MSDKHDCPVDGCAAQVPRSMLMCARHWRLVPDALQSAVYRQWRRRQRDDDGAMADHLQACENAIAHVENRQPRELFG